ncbi:hypothetical protein BKA81DRAFT_18872 [Phyllosticta paracitricarpa]|uniref:Uncharacterized protein n=1 Tax=Phyllosticta citricarpa TaxID=55181 RepID=A0ABR1MGL9_9PEZI
MHACPSSLRSQARSRPTQQGAERGKYVKPKSSVKRRARPRTDRQRRDSTGRDETRQEEGQDERQDFLYYQSVRYVPYHTYFTYFTYLLAYLPFSRPGVINLIPYRTFPDQTKQNEPENFTIRLYHRIIHQGSREQEAGKKEKKRKKRKKGDNRDGK